jgi:hypothetical protein
VAYLGVDLVGVHVDVAHLLTDALQRRLHAQLHHHHHTSLS